jgi:hypothetical protein
LDIAFVYSLPTYQWSKDSVPLVNGPTSHGSTISGAQSYDLQIISAQPQDAGSYDCVVTNACGSVNSIAATLTVAGPCPPSCPADVSGDQQVNITDLLAVISAWGPCAGCPADINGDGAVNITDLLTVISGWGSCA